MEQVNSAIADKPCDTLVNCAVSNTTVGLVFLRSLPIVYAAM